jgi:hypothetical protein
MTPALVAGAITRSTASAWMIGAPESLAEWM